MTRKILATASILFILSASAVMAKVGDVAGTIYTTDILTQVDGLDIKSYSIDGMTLIALEDLEPYGFNVYYNDNIRSVFITKAAEASPDFRPSVERGKVGATAGHYYETDISAYVNGRYIKAYAIDGKMVAEVEQLGGNRMYNFNRQEYQMAYSYDDSKRLLSLYTDMDRYGTPDGGKDVTVHQRLWSPTYARILHRGERFATEKHFGGLPHGGTQTDVYVCLDNGLLYRANGIAALYDIEMEDPVISEDGTKLYFKNHDRLTGEFRDYKQMEIDNTHTYPLDKETYDRAANTFGESDFTATLNAKDVPLYSIGSEDCFRLSDVIGAGYNREKIRNIKTHDSVQYVPLSEFEHIDISEYNKDLNTVFLYEIETYGAKLFYCYDVYNKTVTAKIIG